LLSGRRIVVVLPAYNAARTLRATVAELDRSVVDGVILVDDASSDGTVALARELGLDVIAHDRNAGYGANQKTCYAAALRAGADVVVMLHPDYQYAPRLVPALAWMVASGEYDAALGSRIIGGAGARGRMPLWRYAANRLLTFVQNLLGGSKLSEFHTGFRAWSREVLETLPLGEAADGFVFDDEMLAQAVRFGFRVGEISCPARYFPEASSIGFPRAVRYGLGVLRVSLLEALARVGFYRSRLFREGGRRLDRRPSTGSGRPERVEGREEPDRQAGEAGEG
jgi:glycosyltransferase involved in cell wall biosynthesis